MMKNIKKQKKAIVMTIILSAILFLTPLFNPIVYGSTTIKKLEHLDENSLKINNFLDYVNKEKEDITLNKIHCQLKEFFGEEKLSSRSKFLIEKLFTNLEEKIGKEHRNEYLAVLSWYIKEIENIKKSPLNSIKSIYKNMQTFFDSKLIFSQTSDTLSELSYKTGHNFDTFKNHYQLCDDVWHGRTNYFWYNMYPVKANTYFDWTESVDTLMTKLFWGSFFLGVISGGIIFFGQESVVDFFGLMLMTILLFYDASFMVYAYNSCLHFDVCQDMQPEILIHLIDNNGTGIKNYEGSIIAKNLDAIDVSINKQDNDSVWKEHFFTYRLGDVKDISANIENNDFDENGWYSLSNRHFVENIYEKAPCPPGEWEIEVKSTSEWQGKSKTIDKVEGMKTTIVEIKLERDR